jgi:hypothetical protein
MLTFFPLPFDKLAENQIAKAPSGKNLWPASPFLFIFQVFYCMLFRLAFVLLLLNVPVLLLFFLKKLPLHFSPHIFPLLFNDSLGFHQVLFHQQLFSVPPLLLALFYDF